MGCVLQKAHALIGDVEENHCSSQHTAGADHLHIQHVGDAHEQKNQYFAADALKADLAGEGFVCNRTHDACDVVDHHKGEECVKQTVSTAEEVAKPPSDSCKCKLNRVPEFFHDVVPPLKKLLAYFSVQRA